MSDDAHEYTRDPLIRAFGAVLRAHREEAGLSRAQLAEALGCSPQWIEKLETGKKPSKESAIDLDTFFKIPARTFQRMWEEIEGAGRRPAAPPGFRRYVELEKQASKIRTFEALLITGLFQTADYARTVLASFLAPEAVEPALATRMERKQILTGDHPPRMWLTIDEWVLRRTVGGPAVMRDQLRHLLELGEHPHTMIQILPRHTTDQYVGALSASLTLLGFDGSSEVAYAEAAGQGNLIQEPHAVADCAIRYETLRGHALSVAESRHLIEKVMEDL
ncbi:helix-turn-helix domain-containing protein [Actinomadura alba]|uniref:Helix-turn-helix domain-containing protein n=1 Tax=Actinomadura alba TaxID=406431 RepID=A0ABR7LH51_9ACTN|nr:helix-turn-helix transcriptional regulator [Actinomadura alba]MBC6464179.1 helix-turn-helix domain-containing protein [Actinomadura alba]